MYHVINSEPGLYTVGEGTPGHDWQPIADYDRYDVAQAEAERLNSPQVYALLDKAQRQINELMTRMEALERAVARSARVDNENNHDWQGH